MRAPLAVLLLAAACGGSPKPVEPVEATEPVAEVEEVDAEGENPWSSYEGVELTGNFMGGGYGYGHGYGYGGGTGYGGYGASGAAVPALDQASLDAGGTGSPECDELIKRTMCSYQMAGSAVPAEAIKAFEDGVAAWKDALKLDSVRQAVIDACKMSVDAGDAGFDAVGC